MKKMHTEEQIKKIAESGHIEIDPVPTEDSENAVSSGGVYESLLGKVSVLEKTNNVFTEEEFEKLKQGVFINGVIDGVRNPILLPLFIIGENNTFGLYIGSQPNASVDKLTTISMYKVNTNSAGNKVISCYATPGVFFNLNGVYINGSLYLQSKKYPDYPSAASQNLKNFYFILSNGNLMWREGNGLYLHTVMFVVGSENISFRFITDNATPLAYDQLTGNYIFPNARVVQPINHGNFIFTPFSTNGFNPDVYEFNQSTGAFDNSITLDSIDDETVTPLG